ncbi:hypothetical protein ACOZ32_00535 [Halobacterium sp. MBLA0001]|jgi:hypothetical protein|uniref:hypothetical protein n=1 Tax=Halobacterium sp. MBLA0001 TaxID=3413511 RepID=UPI003C718C20
MDDTESPEPDENHALQGATDRAALVTIRDIITEIEPLATPHLDDYLHPSVLEVTLADGIGDAKSARIDIVWTTQDNYKFHYTDSAGVNLRWGKHPHNGDYPVPDLEHYHPPPDASSTPDDVEASCIEQTPEELVARAVFKLWRVGYHADSYDRLNDGRNPP